MRSDLHNPADRTLDVRDLTDEQFDLVCRYAELVRSPGRVADAGREFKQLLAFRRSVEPEITEEEADQLADEAVTWARRAG